MAGIHMGRGRGRPHHGGALPGDFAATSGVAAAARAAAEGSAPEDTVPQEVKQKLIELLKEKGPLQQAKIPAAWSEAYPGVPLAYKEWGFDRLKDALLEIPDAIRLEKDPSGRDFIVSLAGTSGGNLASAADGEKIDKQKHILLSGQKYAFTIDCLARDFAASLPGGLGPTQDARKGARHHHHKMQRENSQVSV